jgi:endonuclease/exonuclease/phosphatase family metal-dependent hydrolase
MSVSSSRSLRVASYNIHKSRGLDRRVKPERVLEVIRELDADVIALQEIMNVNSDDARLGQARYLAAELSGYSWCFGDNRDLKGGPYGNMTLSRFPIKFFRNYDVTWRKRERRGCLRSDLALDEKNAIHFFNVHLGTGFIERRHQARKLVSADILQHGKIRGPKIVAGDFNEWTRGLASRLMGENFQSIDLKQFLKSRRTYPGILPFLHLDHIYFDHCFELRHFRLHRSRTALVASDHLPIVAELELLK